MPISIWLKDFPRFPLKEVHIANNQSIANSGDVELSEFLLLICVAWMWKEVRDCPDEHFCSQAFDNLTDIVGEKNNTWIKLII